MSFLQKANSHVWSVADQVLVSGCNFLIGIALARFLGLAGFGMYAVAQMYILYGNTFQQALVSAPMMTAVPAEPNANKRMELIAGFFAYSLGGSALIVIVVELLAWGVGQLADGLDLGGIALPLAVALAAYQLQDWLRRVLYVHTNNRAVCVGDAMAYLGQLAGIVILGWQGMLSVKAALWVMAVAFGLSALLVIATQALRPNAAAARLVIRANWRNSRNLLIAAQMQWLASSGVVLVGAGVIGPQAAGGIRVAQNLLGPVNVVFQWMENVLPVRATLLFRDHGLQRLRAYLLRIGLLGGGAIAAFTVVLAFVNEWLMVTVYGEAYRGFAVLLVLQALYYFFGHGYRMVSYLCRATGHTGDLARASTWWAIVAMVAALGLVQWYAERGVMFALIAGELAGVTYLLWEVNTRQRRVHE